MKELRQQLDAWKANAGSRANDAVVAEGDLLAQLVDAYESYTANDPLSWEPPPPEVPEDIIAGIDPTRDSAA